MNTKTFGWASFAVIVLVLLVVFAPGSGSDDFDVISPEESDAFVPDGVEVLHRFRDGTHTLFGSVDLPTPCYTMESNVIVAESYPEQVTVEFTAVVDEDIMCTQVISPSAFSIEVDANENATFKARFNKVAIPLKLKKESL